jgi:hypothetical protein
MLEVAEIIFFSDVYDVRRNTFVYNESICKSISNHDAFIGWARQQGNNYRQLSIHADTKKHISISHWGYHARMRVEFPNSFQVETGRPRILAPRCEFAKSCKLRRLCQSSRFPSRTELETNDLARNALGSNSNQIWKMSCCWPGCPFPNRSTGKRAARVWAAHFTTRAELDKHAFMSHVTAAKLVPVGNRQFGHGRFVLHFDTRWKMTWPRPGYLFQLRTDN